VLTTANFDILFPFNIEIANAREPIGGIAATVFLFFYPCHKNRFLLAAIEI
jgi:hypothetical protein